jgi:hypothetical protein
MPLCRLLGCARMGRSGVLCTVAAVAGVGLPAAATVRVQIVRLHAHLGAAPAHGPAPGPKQPRWSRTRRVPAYIPKFLSCRTFGAGWTLTTLEPPRPPERPPVETVTPPPGVYPGCPARCSPALALALSTISPTCSHESLGHSKHSLMFHPISTAALCRIMPLAAVTTITKSSFSMETRVQPGQCPALPLAWPYSAQAGCSGPAGQKKRTGKAHCYP